MFAWCFTAPESQTQRSKLRCGRDMSVPSPALTPPPPSLPLRLPLPPSSPKNSSRLACIQKTLPVLPVPVLHAYELFPLSCIHEHSSTHAHAHSDMRARTCTYYSLSTLKNTCATSLGSQSMPIIDAHLP